MTCIRKLESGCSKRKRKENETKLTQSMALLKTPCSLPKFENLTHMKLESYGWKLLPSLLDSSPRLVDLDFVLGFVDMDTAYCGNRFPPPEHVPVCLSHHLKVINFGSFLGEEDEYKWVNTF